jgi:hypothetical protein
MSKFRCEVDVSFNNESDAIAFFNLVESWKDKIAPSTESHGPQDIAIVTRARYHECFHDEIPPKPCGDFFDVDFKNPEIAEHVTKSGDVMVINADNTMAVTKEAFTAEMIAIDKFVEKPLEE